MDYTQLIQDINALLPRLREIADDSSLPHDTRSQAEDSGAALIAMLDYLGDDESMQPIVHSSGDGSYALATLYATAISPGLPQYQYMSKGDLKKFIEQRMIPWI